MNFVKQFSIFLILWFYVISSLSAQGIRKIDNNFLYQEQIYKYKEMGDIFSKNIEAHRYFISANKKLRTGKTLGFISLSSLGLGSILLAGVNREDGLSDSDENITLLGAMSIALIGIPTGFSSLIKIGKGKEDKRVSVDLFNQEYGFQLPKENPLELSFVFNNGIGFQLKF